MKYVVAAFGLAAVVCGIAGCGGGPVKYKISGALTKGGQPLAVTERTLVTLVFMPETKDSKHTYPATFKPLEKKYSVEVPPGKYRVNLLLTDYAKNPPVPRTPKNVRNTVYELNEDKVLDIDIGN